MIIINGRIEKWKSSRHQTINVKSCVGFFSIFKQFNSLSLPVQRAALPVRVRVDGDAIHQRHNCVVAKIQFPSRFMSRYTRDVCGVMS